MFRHGNASPGGKRRATRPESPVIGFALRLTNQALGMEYDGWPHSIAEEMKRRGHDPVALARELETEIAITELRGVPAWNLKGEPGDRAAVVMQLMAALEDRAYDEARSLLGQHPATLKSDAAWASFPLLASACAGDLDAVELLLAHEARLDASDDLEMTALHWSAACGLSAMTARLLEQGANKAALSVLLVTPGELAILNEHSGVSRMFGPQIAVSDLGAAIIERMSTGSTP
jgi:hypothetical protein